MAPGASFSGIALANGLNRNQLFTWRRQLLVAAPGRLAVLLPVKMEAPDTMVVNMQADLTRTKPTLPGSHIEIAVTHLTARVHGQVDPATLRIVLQWLAR